MTSAGAREPGYGGHAPSGVHACRGRAPLVRS